MPVAISFTFPLGEYHATSWDKAVNSGAPEWPPSPWRILRGLLSTWHTRCPHIDESVIDTLLRKLVAQPPVYRLPETTYSETRHYMPLLRHKSTEPGDTAKTLAPRLHITSDSALIVVWPDVDLDRPEKAALAELAGLIPYLGRSESICRAKVVDAPLVSADDADLAVPVDRNEADTLVLVPVVDATRAQLEGTPDQMRAARRLTPEGARWQGYRLPVYSPSVGSPRRASSGQRPTAIRWSINARHLMRFADGVGATSVLRWAALRNIKKVELDKAPGSELLSGPHHASHGLHEHAHWLWLDDGGQHRLPWESAYSREVSQLALWVPGGIDGDLLGELLRVRQLPRLPYEPRGYVPGHLNLQALGSVESVLPQLVGGPSRRWRSVTPMLTERHMKGRHDGDEQRRSRFVAKEIERELSYRVWSGVSDGAPREATPAGVRVVEMRAWDDESVSRFRRYRHNERLNDRRRGFFVEFELDTAIFGPMCIGALSHFGFGRFEPL